MIDLILPTQNSGLVSVIIPSFNASSFILASVKSVLAQTYEHFELLVIDDCSTDNTFELLREVAHEDDRVSVFTTLANSGGPATPRNLGLSHAKGEYFAFLDADDLWHSRKLEIQLQVIQLHGASFVSCDAVFFRGEFPVAAPEYKETKTIPFIAFSYQALLMKNRVVASGVLLSRALLPNGMLNFDTQPELVAIEDYQAWLSILQGSDRTINVIKAKLVFYRLRNNSISSSKLEMMRKIHYLYKHRVDWGNFAYVKRSVYFFVYVVMGIFLSLKQWIRSTIDKRKSQIHSRRVKRLQIKNDRPIR